MKKVLLACGSYAVNQKVASAIISKHGYTISDSATCGSETMRKIAEGTPDVAFINFNLPMIDGLTIINLVKQFEWNTKIVIINLSADVNSMRKALGIGANGYLSCVDDEEINWCLETVMSGGTYVDTAVYYQHYFSRKG